MDGSLALALALETADMSQTLYIAKHPAIYGELNPILGKHPSQAKVVLYFVTCDASLIAANYVLPKRYAHILNVATIAVEAAVVGRNAHFGVRFTF